MIRMSGQLRRKAQPRWRRPQRQAKGLAPVGQEMLVTTTTEFNRP
jgi:hypothetical protein